MKYLSLISFWFLVITAFSCAENVEPFVIDEAYKEEIKIIREKLIKSRKTNYLPLIGLYKLNDGINTIGKDSSNTFVLPIENLPPTIAGIAVLGNQLVFTAADNVEVLTANDSMITSMPLTLDEYGSSIKLYHERLNWQVITRSKVKYIRIWDTENPAIENFEGFKRYDLNPNLVINGQFTFYETPKNEIVKSEVDGQRNTSFIGKITFDYLSEEHALDVGSSGFTMVSDATTGEETYGGGRYMYLNLPKTDSIIRLDFNKLYNPPCAFNEFTTCLYPPRQNHLPFKVEAGETITPNN